MTLANKSKIKWALFWNYLQKTSGHALKFIIGIILARLLEPEHFGLIAMISIFTAFSNRVMGLGLSSALIQKKDIDDTDCNTVFFTNLGLGIFCYAVLFTAAPAIASFYNQVSLDSIIRVSALNLILQSGFAVHSTLLSKTFDFKSSLRVNTIAAFVGGSVSIYLAIYGYAVWALVFGTLCSNLLRVILFWRQSHWNPQFSFSITRLRTLLPFGSKVTFLGLIEVLFTNLHTVVIGRLFSSTTLGFYARANSLQQFVSTGIAEPLRGVIYPAFSKVQNQPKELRKTFFRTLELTVFLVFPAMLFVAIEARPFITVLIGEKWIPAAPLLKILCIIGAIIPIRHQCSIALKALGRVGAVIKYQVFGRSFSIVAIILTYRYGIEAMLMGEILATAILVIVFLTKTSKELSCRIIEQVYCMAPYGIATFVAGISTLAIVRKLEVSNLTELAVAFLAESATYLIMLFFIRTPLSKEIRKIVVGRLGGRNHTDK